MSSLLTGSERGLVGYWNFNEGSGDVANDQSGNGNDGSINGAEYSTDTPEFLDVEMGEFGLLVNGESNVLALSYRDPMELTFVYETGSNDTIQMEVYRDMNFNGYLDDDDVNLYDHVPWFFEVLDQYPELLTFADNAGSNDLGPGDQNLADGVYQLSVGPTDSTAYYWGWRFFQNSTYFLRAWDDMDNETIVTVQILGEDSQDFVEGRTRENDYHHMVVHAFTDEEDEDYPIPYFAVTGSSGRYHLDLKDRDSATEYRLGLGELSLIHI